MKNNNSVHQAVRKVGGATQASFLLRVNPATIYRWQRTGVIPRFDKATILAKASGLNVEALRPIDMECVEEAA